jgi:hypothetical protein
VHPYGNPHIWLDPLNVKEMAANIAQGLEKVDAAHAAVYEERLKKYQDKIDVALFGEALVKEVGGRMLSRKARDGKLDDYLETRHLADKLGGWLAQARPLKGRPVVTYHKSWVYFAARFGLEIPIEIEEKPGIPPSARHRDAVVELIKKRGVKTILHEVFYDRGAAEYLAKQTSVTSSKLGVIGFCMGGQLALYAGSVAPELIGAVVDMYGIHPNVKPDFSKLQAPVLGLFGGKDAFVPAEAIEALSKELDANGVKHDFHTYEQCDHAFMNDRNTHGYDAEATQDAYSRIIPFFRQNLR